MTNSEPPAPAESMRANPAFEKAQQTLALSSALAAASLDVRSVVKSMAQLAVDALCDWCAIVLVQPDGSLVRVAGAHRDAAKRSTLQALLDVPIEPDAPIMRVVTTGESVVVARVDRRHIVAHLEDPQHQSLVHELGVASMMIVPLRARDKLIGAISLISTHAQRAYSNNDLELAEAFALRAALQIENARLYEREQAASQRFAFLARVGEVLVSSLDLQTTLNSIVGLIVPEFADWATISLLDEQGRIRTAALDHVDQAKLAAVRSSLSSYTIDPAGPIGSAYAIRTGRPQISSQVDPAMVAAFAVRSDRPDLAASTLNTLGFHSFIAVPMQARGQMIGSIVAMWAQPDREYAEDDIPFFQDISRRSALAIQNAESYERERRVASSLQASFLPHTLPQLEGLEFDALYEPGASEVEIGGDWYDAFSLEDGRVVVAIGDVSGHGLEAAIVMAKAREMLRALAIQGLAPNAILNVADTALKMDGRTVLVTAMVAIIDADRRRLTFASAGHPPALLVEPGGAIRELGRTGIPLGAEIGADAIGAACVDIAPGSMLVLHTDGLTEATRDPLHGQALLVAALRDEAIAASITPARAIHDHVLSTRSRDDVAILTLRFQG